MDAVHAPTGCGTWPAWWMNGDNWPYGGEIDIMEGVNAFSQNQISIHTGSGCRIPSNTNDLQTGSLTTGWFDSYNCAAYETGNEGCGVRDLTSGNSFGEGFNAAGGGVYARKSLFSSLPTLADNQSNGLRPVSKSGSLAETTSLPTSRPTNPTLLPGESPLPTSEETLVILTSSLPKTSTSLPTLSVVIGLEPTLSGTLPVTLVRLNHVLPRLVTLLVPTTSSTRVPPSARPTGR